MKFLMFCLVIMTFIGKNPVFSQEINIDVDTTQIYRVVEQMPEFPGGEAKMFRYLIEELSFPAFDSNGVILGKINIRFVIDENGAARDIEVLNPIPVEVKKEIIRVFNSMPKWKPGVHKGKRVRVEFVVPIRVLWG